MKRLNSKKPLNKQIYNEESLRKSLSSSCNTHPSRSYSEVVAFGNNDPSSVTSRVSSPKLYQPMSTGNCSLEAFPPLIEIAGFSNDENDVILLNDSICSVTLKKEPTTYGTYLETRFKAEETEDSEHEVNLRSILEIHIDDFNFTEVDNDPESSSFPRFVGVFEDKEYLKLEKEVLKSFEKFIF